MQLSTSLLVGILSLTQLVTAAQSCSAVDVSPPPFGYTCNSKGVTSSPKVLSKSTVKTRYDCASACLSKAGCASFSIQRTSCTLYSQPLKNMGFKGAAKSTVAYSAKACYEMQCQNTPPTTTTPNPTPNPSPNPSPDPSPAPPTVTACQSIPPPNQQFQLQIYGFLGGPTVGLVDDQLTSYYPASATFYLDDYGNLCTGNKIVYWPSSSQNADPPFYGMNLAVIDAKSLPKAARTAACAYQDNFMACYAPKGGWFYQCPGRSYNLLLGSANPDPNSCNEVLIYRAYN